MVLPVYRQPPLLFPLILLELLRLYGLLGIALALLLLSASIRNSAAGALEGRAVPSSG